LLKNKNKNKTKQMKALSWIVQGKPCFSKEANEICSDQRSFKKETSPGRTSIMKSYQPKQDFSIAS
jgi:hypothetical protein